MIFSPPTACSQCWAWRWSRSQHHRPRRRTQSTVAGGVQAAQPVLSPGAGTATTTTTSQTSAAPAVGAIPGADTSTGAGAGLGMDMSMGLGIDPLRIVGKEMKFLTKNIQQLLGSGHPVLNQVAKYYAQSEGKRIRPMVVLLMSRATALTRPAAGSASASFRASSPPAPAARTMAELDAPFSPASVLLDSHAPALTSSSPVYLTDANDDADDSVAAAGSDVLPTQRRLAEIVELIHTASLLHDDVIDNSTARRSYPSANLAFGNKMAVLAGDFLLGRASIALARLRDPAVIELVSTTIANLVEGEFMQLKNTADIELDPSAAPPRWTDDTLAFYLQKTYLKSASLISKSCRSAAVLGRCPPAVVEAAYAYGKNLGLAFQLVDDMLDYTVSGLELGKPAGADLKLGLATAPLLFAWKEHAELGALVARRFQAAGDVERVSRVPFFVDRTCVTRESVDDRCPRLVQARALVAQSDGIEHTRALAQQYADRAVAAIAGFPDGAAKTGLMEVCVKTMQRRK
ncbi:MAG: coq1 putative hexaprenyl diphosphate synthase [Phylliscum demangeonii]|nr:MAG: coq1 putative hexaprenyl diphosphate synthase [Phylliscum demangeonii]